MYLGLVYLLSWDSIIFARLLKCLWGALSCLLIYRLGKRNFGEQIGRVAAILMMLESHFWIYGGMHLKETEMIFMMLLFLERADNLVRTRRFDLKNIVLVVVLLASLFTFRTVLGLTALFSLALALMLSSQRVISWGKRIVFLLVFGMTALYFVGGRISSEIEQLWERNDGNQEARMSEIVETQSLAKYAGAAVFAPMIFTIPFPTMVETEGQEVSRMLHGGMVTKGIMSFFCLVAVISLLFKVIPGKNNWRQHILIGAFLIAYLGILVFSAFAHADRFHMPALPLEILFVAYGLSLWQVKIFQRWYNWWLILMVVAFVAWNWFKLSGRGLV
jgi:4-amino-4-deoxy-L-arabinose transferase-like glycosyltransferase